MLKCSHTTIPAFSLHVQIPGKCVDAFNQCNAFIPLFLNCDLVIVGDMSQIQFGLMLIKLHIYEYQLWSIYMACSSYWSEVEGWRNMFRLPPPLRGFTSGFTGMNILMSFLWSLIKHFTVNSMRPRQNWCRFAHNIFKCIFTNENFGISIDIHWIFNWNMFLKV